MKEKPREEIDIYQSYSNYPKIPNSSTVAKFATVRKSPEKQGDENG
jgi:hypothetical protein